MAAKVRVSTKFKEAVKFVLLMRVYCLNFLLQTIENVIQIPIG